MKENLSVLIVDDDEDDYFILSEYLMDMPGKTIELTWASTYSEAIELLTNQKFSICFFDYQLGAKTGLDLLQVASNLKLQTPIILLTGKSNASIDQQALQLGVSDYMEKSEIDSRKLDRSIRYALERTSVLKSLQESEEKYKSIFSGSLDALCLLDVKGHFLDANPVTLSLINLDQKSLLKTHITDYFISPDNVQHFMDSLDKGETIPEWELQIKDSKGVIYDCILACTKIQIPGDPDNSFFRCILRDITKRKKMEQQILAAEKLAATGRFMRMLGHEIRNPLNNILMAATQLREETNDEDLDYFIDIIERNSARISQLVTELLQSTGNQSQILWKSAPLNTLLDDTISMAADRISLKNIKLITHINQENIILVTDQAKLSIALLNIIVNGLEVVDANTGVLTIEADKKDLGTLITISDNGPGIEAHLQERIFEPYYTAKHNGVGLGLSATKSIVEALHGTVTVSSTPGAGTTFSVWLPQENQEN
jgi:PAS domain S-box-containing protein